ncbi:glycosyl hydrolase family 28 protein [Pelagicoccus sp. SDUM812005]|uniref:glycosyl hydrolase family 28 protein n=1 Tax=Pelagicoccus sp. SDUM812005 TaxID=3041257 RepID=UPI0028108281|nr:glycosyl hydrolase family 28 protein [Pelagicoccus sp. SDUM812005]MDQ8183311.1 glycosyl hydrolase family 28 protein [Pelagicoccus sp. SDUM812005]
MKTLLTLVVALAGLSVLCAQERVKVYPAPDGIELSQVFAVQVAGEEVPVYKAKIPPAGPIPRLTRDPSAFAFASFASFDLQGKVEVKIECSEPVSSIKVLPTSYGIVPKVHGKTVALSIDGPRQVTVEINGDWHESLHIFANPMEENVPDPDDPNVIYFGPGVHELTHLAVGDDTTVYVAGGAYIRGGMDASEEEGQVGLRTMYLPTFMLSGKNIEFRGRGIIEQGAIPRPKRRYSLYVGDSENVTIEGVTFLDPSRWTVPIKRSKDIHVDNIKIIGWRGNSDGVDISSSQDVLVENCFLRTLDDLVVVKSRTGQGESKNIHVRNCVLWNELAHALSIGAEVREDVSNVLFEDCDVIHDVGRETALRVYHCDDATISDVTFRNIRIEEARRLISCWIGTTRWTKTPERGNIRNVLFQNITATSAPIDPTLEGFQDGTDWKPYVIKDHASIELVGFDSEHTVEGVVFDNVILDGRKVEAGNVMMNEFVEDVRFK